jgi:hypothetical protein
MADLRPAEERRGFLRRILRSTEYQQYRNKHGHIESETEMTDLEVDEPQLFNMLKKATRKRQKRHRRRVPARKVQSISKIKQLKLRVQQPASMCFHQSSQTLLTKKVRRVTLCSSNSNVVPSAVRPFLISNGFNLNPSSSASELAQINHRPASMFRVDIPARGYHITASQNPKRRTIFEEPQYTDDGDFPMVTRTSELVRKNLVGPLWRELSLERDIVHHDRQPSTQTEDPMDEVDSEMAEVLSYLKTDSDDLFDDILVAMADGTGE